MDRVDRTESLPTVDTAPGSDEEPFALLDDNEAAAGVPASRLHLDFSHEHRCVDPDLLEATCARVEADLAAGLHAVLVADYEWGTRLLRAGLRAGGVADAGCLRVLMFRTLRRLDEAGVARWLAEREGRADPAPAGVLDLRPDISRDTYEAAIGRIHEAIRDGETYQVNFTYRLHGRAHGSPVALYRRLRARQRVSFGALMRLPMQAGDTTEWVLSRSPELFVRHAGGRLLARPMKGTAARSRAPEGDSETARLLHEDVKNRAENLMIVDLLRNDLGRVAVLGSVAVPELFRVEPYATVFQMTSTIEATRRPDVGLAGLLRALYPCGSITGAPKHRTMAWIAALESSPRGLYTGAIGWLSHAHGGCPDLALSVAIRTLALGAPSAGTRPVTLGVGGGIVHDSVAADEWDETRWKARFLTALDPGFELFETMRADAGGVAHLARHRERMAASARTLGFAFDPLAFDEQAARAAREAGALGGSLRVRIGLRHDGRLALATTPLSPLVPASLEPSPIGATPATPAIAMAVTVLLAAEPLPAARPLAGHKTTVRADYDAGIRAAEAAGAFDTLFLGSRGELVEGGRSNVFVRLDGRWFTPPLADGVLPGVMRAVLLDDPAWAATERRLTRADVDRAEALVVCNALRGVLRATIAAAPVQRAIAA